VAFSPCGERAFVPFTAAGQRGLCTPLPHIHLVLLRGELIKHLLLIVNDNLPLRLNRFMPTLFAAIGTINAVTVSVDNDAESIER